MSEMRKVSSTADRLREAMRDAGKKQTDLAAAAGLNRSTWRTVCTHSEKH